MRLHGAIGGQEGRLEIVATRADAFHSARLKVARANRHIDELNASLAAFAAEEFYYIDVIHEADPRQTRIAIRLTKSIPDNVPLIIGDVVHNLHCALDHLFNEVVGDQLVERDRVFPFGKRRKDLEASPKVEALEQAMPGARQVVMDEVEPYFYGRHGLYQLHRLDIVDKHNELIVTANGAMISLMDFSYPAGGGLEARQNRFSLDQDALVAVVPGHLRLDFASRPVLEIGFGPGLPFQNEPVVPTLTKLSGRIRDVIRDFAVLRS
jgi:hypothetical protein